MSARVHSRSTSGGKWGKRVAPRQAARFHVVVILSVLLGVGLLLTTLDPVQLTVYAVLVSERNRLRLFGYDRPETTGPLPITRLAKALQGPLRENMHRRNRYSSKRRGAYTGSKSLTVQVPRP